MNVMVQPYILHRAMRLVILSCVYPGTSHGSTLYTTSDVHDLVCDISFDESQFQTDESSSSDSELDIDLSDPVASSFLKMTSKTMICLHKVIKMKRVVMVSLGVMTTILILLVVVKVGMLILLREHIHGRRNRGGHRSQGPPSFELTFHTCSSE